MFPTNNPVDLRDSQLRTSISTSVAVRLIPLSAHSNPKMRARPLPLSTSGRPA
jgi:hypothetical protein